MGTVEEKAEDLREGRSGEWLVRLTRYGYATRGVIFLLVGVWTLQVTVGLGGDVTGTREAMRNVSRRPFGHVLMLATAVGLGGYVLWRFFQAVLNPFFDDDGAGQYLRRFGYLMSGLFYALLALTAVQLALGLPNTKNSRDRWAAWMLDQPLGPWVVGAIGLGIGLGGLHTVYRGLTGQFMQLYPEGMDRRKSKLVLQVGRLGLVTLGLTMIVVGYHAVKVSLTYDPSETIGLGGALHVLGTQPYGPWLLGSVAFGFVAYGIHCFALGRYRKVRTSDDSR